MAPKKSKNNPFNQRSSANEKKNKGTNILENIKNPFGSNAAPVKDDSNTKINSSKSKRSLHDGNKDILLKNQENKKNVDEKKIISGQSIGLLITFIFIFLSLIINIRLGKYLITNYADDKFKFPDGTFKFPINAAWRESEDYQRLVNYEGGWWNFFSFSTLHKGSGASASISGQAGNKDLKVEKVAAAVAETIKTQKGGCRTNCKEEIGDKPTNPLFLYWVGSAISFSLLLFNHIIHLYGFCVQKVYKNSDEESGRILNFFKNLGRDIIFIIFSILVNLIIPIITIVYSFYAFWDFLFTFFIYNYWNTQSIKYNKTNSESPGPCGGWCESLWKLFVIININMLFKSLWLFWGIIFVIGKFILLVKMLMRLFTVIYASNPNSNEKNEKLFMQSGYRTGAGYFIISACLAFIKIFNFEHLDYIPITLSIITFISIILLPIYIN